MMSIGLHFLAILYQFESFHDRLFSLIYFTYKDWPHKPGTWEIPIEKMMWRIQEFLEVIDITKSQNKRVWNPWLWVSCVRWNFPFMDILKMLCFICPPTYKFLSKSEIFILLKTLDKFALPCVFDIADKWFQLYIFKESNLSFSKMYFFVTFSEGSASLSSLVDTVHQTRVIELLITFAYEIFGAPKTSSSQQDELCMHKIKSKSLRYRGKTEILFSFSSIYVTKICFLIHDIII